MFISTDIILKIYKYLSFKDLVLFSRINSLWRECSKKFLQIRKLEQIKQLEKIHKTRYISEKNWSEFWENKCPIWNDQFGTISFFNPIEKKDRYLYFVARPLRRLPQMNIKFLFQNIPKRWILVWRKEHRQWTRKYKSYKWNNEHEVYLGNIIS